VPFGNDAFDAFWIRVWAGVILSRAERQHFAALGLPPTGQLEWLAERNAAKDAVREVLTRAYRLQLRASDVELAENGRGQLSVRGWWLRSTPIPPVVATTYGRGRATALASLAQAASANAVLDALRGDMRLASTEDARA